MKHGSRTQAGARACLALLAGLVAAAGAQAAPPALPSENGLLVLPNVKLEKSSQPVDGKAGAMRPGAGAVKAYKDRETGQLRRATPEDLLDEAQAAAPSNDPAGTRITTYGNGRKSGLLDESFMSYSVVRKGQDGKLDTHCVTGETAAQHALHGKTTAKEHRHAH